MKGKMTPEQARRHREGQQFRQERARRDKAGLNQPINPDAVKQALLLALKGRK